MCYNLKQSMISKYRDRTEDVYLIDLPAIQKGKPFMTVRELAKVRGVSPATISIVLN